jgi:hypothetical protein
VGLLASTCAGLAVLGGVSSWFVFSILNINVYIRGTNTHLDGRYAIGLGVAGIVLAGLSAGVPRRGVARRLALGAVAVIGVAGLLLMWHQYRHLADTAAELRASNAFSNLTKYLGVHGAATWGFWLDVAAFGALLLVAVAGSLTAWPSRPLDRSQRSAIDRDDAASEVRRGG